MGCPTLVSNGRNSNCEDYTKRTVAAIIVEAGGYEFTAAQLNNIATWKPYLFTNTNATMVQFNGTEVTDAEVQQETTGFGTNYIVSESAPSLMGYITTNVCDFTDMLDSFDGGTYDVFLYDAGGNLISTRAGNKFKGFKTQVYAQAKGAIGSDNQTQQYKISFNFLSELEWRKPSVIKASYDLFKLYELIPDGLTQPYESELTAAGTVSFPISSRCVENGEIAIVVTGNVITNNVPGETPTAVPTYNATTEEYDWLVTRDGAAVPVFGDVFEVRSEYVDGTTKKISNVTKFTVANS